MNAQGRPAPCKCRRTTEGPPDMISARACGMPALTVPGDQAWTAPGALGFEDRDVTIVMAADWAGRLAAQRIHAISTTSRAPSPRTGATSADDPGTGTGQAQWVTSNHGSVRGPPGFDDVAGGDPAARGRLPSPTIRMGKPMEWPGGRPGEIHLPNGPQVRS